MADDFLDPPDVAVEIVSPEQRVTALVRRCLRYVTHGVQVALLVDSADASVLVFRPEQVPQALCNQDQIDLRDVLPGLTLQVQEVFDALSMR